MKKRLTLLAILLVVTLLTSSSLVQGQDESILIVAERFDLVPTLDPGRAFETTNLMIHAATYDTLLTIRPDNLTEIVPSLAAGYEVSEDGLVYTFTLKEGLVFSSGNPITAEDVRFSWMRLKNIKGNPSFYADPVETVEAVDDLTVKVTLTAPFPAFPAVVTAPAMSILDSQVVIEHGGTDAEDADTTDNAQEWLDQNSAGSGPFVLTRFTPETEIVLVRNDNYWGEAPAVSGITFRYVNDSTTALQQLERGDVDISLLVDPDLADRVTSNSDLKLEVGQSLNITYLAISPSDYFGLPISDVRVRQAIAMAIDYDGIIDALLSGYGDRPAGILPIGTQGSDPSIRYNRDVDAAKALLEEAGVGDGFDITLYIGSGTSVGIPVETFAAKIQSDLSDIGINVTINQQPSSDFFTQYRAQELPFLIATWTPDYLDSTMWSDYFSYPDSGPAFRMRMDIPEIAELADQAAFESDHAKRTELFTQYNQAQRDAAVFIVFLQPQVLHATLSNIEGYAYHPVYIVDFSHISK
jgi:peptide/nickel transport system substrate-binding protein